MLLGSASLPLPVPNVVHIPNHPNSNACNKLISDFLLYSCPIIFLVQNNFNIADLGIRARSTCTVDLSLDLALVIDLLTPLKAYQ